MLTSEAEGILRSRVNSIAIGEQVCERSDLAKYGTIGHDLFLNTFDFCCDTHVNHLVEVVLLTTFVILEVGLWALALLPS